MAVRYFHVSQTFFVMGTHMHQRVAPGVASLSACVRTMRHIVSAFVFAFALTGCAGLQVSTSAPQENSLPALAFDFDDGGKAFYYAFDIGQPAADDPLLFFVSGSGCASVRSRFPGYFTPIRDLPVHVLALQKRGIEPDSTGRDCSDTFIANDYFERIVEDQRSFIERQLKDRKVAPRAIILMGASEGSMVAAKIASTDPRITHLAMVGSGGATMRDNLRLLGKTSWRYKNVDETFNAIAADPHSLTKTALGHSYKYWASMLDVDLGELLLPLQIPILIAMGQHDESVPAEMAVMLKKRFEQRGKTNLIVRIFPEADHRLQDRARSKSYAADFLQELATLVQATARVSATAVKAP